jgi:hypothetical protein
MQHDTHLTEALDADAFVKLVHAAKALVAQTKDARAAELLGWGRFAAGDADKGTVAARKQRDRARDAKAQLAAQSGRERSRKLKDEHPAGGGKLKGDGRHLRRVPSRSQYSLKGGEHDDAAAGGGEALGGGVGAEALAQLKREISHKLKGDDYAQLSPADVKDLQHNQGRKLEGFEAASHAHVADPTPAGISKLEDGGYRTEDDEGEEGGDDSDGDFETFDAASMLAREQSRKVAGDASDAAADALAAAKLSAVGRGRKKAFAEIEADLDGDLMLELRAIFEQCLQDGTAHGNALRRVGFALARDRPSCAFQKCIIQEVWVGLQESFQRPPKILKPQRLF